MAYFARNGFGQVELNKVDGITHGNIHAMLPVKAGMGNYIENGRFGIYDAAKGCVTTLDLDSTARGEWMIIYNEEKLYDERFQSHKDFCMNKEDYINEEMVPRLIKTEIGDIITTNCIGATTGKNSKLTSYTTTFANATDGDVPTGKTYGVENADIVVGTILYVNKDGYLTTTEPSGGAATLKWQVIKIYTMADGQPGLKIQRFE